jgi:hypothetical protein
MIDAHAQRDGGRFLFQRTANPARRQVAYGGRMDRLQQPRARASIGDTTTTS